MTFSLPSGSSPFLHPGVGSPCNRRLLLIAFGSDLAYSREPLESSMQPNQYDAATSTAVCLWCYSQYLRSTSRAREGQTFCSRKCEIEARFWLHDNLKPANE